MSRTSRALSSHISQHAPLTAGGGDVDTESRNENPNAAHAADDDDLIKSDWLISEPSTATVIKDLNLAALCKSNLK